MRTDYSRLIRKSWIVLSAVALLLCCITARAGESLAVDGVPVEVKVSELSAQTIRLEIAPLDQGGNPRPATHAPGLVDFPVKEKFRTRQLADEKNIRAGNFRV